MPLAAQFTIPVADVDRSDVDRTWTLTPEWLERALEDTEATPTGNPGRLTVYVARTGSQFVVRGQVEAEVALPCARTGEPAVYQLRPDLTLLLRQRAVTSGKNSSAKTLARSERHRTRARRKVEEEGELKDEDAASDTFTGDVIELDGFVREQLILEFPMFPLRSDLRSAASAANGPASQTGAAPAAGSEPTEKPLDPRLAPLLDIAKKLKSSKQD